MPGQETAEAKTEATTEVTKAEQEIKQCCENMEDIPEQDTDWFLRNALRTESYDMVKILERLIGPDITRLITKSKTHLVIEPETIRLLHAAMGMETEVGEFMDPLKKYLFYGKPFDKTNLAEEISDVMWYCAIACDTLNISISDIMKLNIAKLRKRFPDKFTEERAINRDLETERATLEKELS